MAYVIRSNDGLYWYQGNDCEGWVDGQSQGTWYGDRYYAELDATKCGGNVLMINPSSELSNDPYYISDFLFHLL